MEEKVLRFLRERYKILSKSHKVGYKSTDLVNIVGQQVSDKISEAILCKEPFVLSRFGSEEIKWYVNYKLLSKSYWERISYFITCATETWKQEGRVIVNPTFVPQTLEMTEVFIEKMDEAIPEIDILGSWLKKEQSSAIKFQKNCEFAYFVDIEPYYHPNPWSGALAGKKVLVIHPMVDSIRRQYSRNTKLFKDARVLPDFDLITLQAKYFDDPEYNNWQKIFDYYIRSIETIDFDVAIVGCGSWGMPVAAHIKKRGKIALHLGGATQILFGIIGTRWEMLYPGFTERFVNENWVRPSKSETPVWAKGYDGNSYW